jgi:signal transduction histidine kinase
MVAVATFAPDYPRELTMYGAIPGTGRVIVLWSLAMAVFLWALEWAAPGALALTGVPAMGMEADAPTGFWVILVHTMCLGYWGWTLVGMVWLGEARRRWAQLPDARSRYDRSGVYGLLRLPVVALVVLLVVPIACVLGLFTAQTALNIPMPFAVSEQRLSLAVCLVLGYSLALGTFTLDYLRVLMVANRVRAESAQRQALQTQLLLLQAQLEPHMLFNTLANLHALIDSDPQRAQSMLSRLIAFLRGTLSASQRSSHALSEEFEHASDYLTLMQVRMGPRLQVVVDLPPELGDVQVPPMLLQPLLENAIQHGLEPTRKGGLLNLSAYRDGPVLVLSVVDTGRGLQEADKARQAQQAQPSKSSKTRRHGGPGGFGLTFVRERLQTIYGDQAQLVLSPAPLGPGTQALLRLPIDWDLPSVPAPFDVLPLGSKSDPDDTVYA